MVQSNAIDTSLTSTKPTAIWPLGLWESWNDNFDSRLRAESASLKLWLVAIPALTSQQFAGCASRSGFHKWKWILKAVGTWEILQANLLHIKRIGRLLGAKLHQQGGAGAGINQDRFGWHLY